MVTRLDHLLKRFAVGKYVDVSNNIPNIRSWPGVHPAMSQFFCGERLKIINIILHPTDPNLMAVELNTKEMGADKNYIFSVDWLSDSDLKEPIKVSLNKVMSIKATRKIKIGKKLFEQSLPAPNPVVATQVVEDTTLAPEPTSWGAAIGGAFATAIGLALKQKLKKSNAVGVNAPQEYVEKQEITV